MLVEALARLNCELRSALFPFNILMDEQLRVLEVGESLGKLERVALPGLHLGELFEVERPHVALEFQQLEQNQELIFVLKRREGRYRLRGQMLVGQGRQVCFLASLWLENLKTMDELGLRLDDFPQHDPTPEVLQLAQAQEVMVRDLWKLNEKLTRQRTELREVNHRLVAQQDEMERLALVAAQTQNPVIFADAQDRIEWVNAGFCTQTGYRPDEVLGKSATELLSGTGTNRQTLEQIAVALARHEAYRCELQNYTKDGSPYWCSLELHPRFDSAGNFAGSMSLQHDITERRQMLRYGQLEVAINRLIADRAVEQDLLERILELVCNELGCCAGLFWRLDESMDLLRCATLWSRARMEHSDFIAMSQSMLFPRGLGLPGRVWESLEPYWMPKLTLEKNFPRLQAAVRGGIHSGFAFPVLAAGQLFGVMEFFDLESRQPDEMLLRVLSGVGQQLGQHLQHNEAQQEQARLFSMLQATLESTADGILVTSSEQKVVSFNQQLQRMWDSEGEFEPGMPTMLLQDLVRLRVLEPDAFIQQVHHLYAHPELVDLSIVHFKDGRVFERYSQPHYLSGKIVGRVWSYHEVTERWRSEQALRENEERFRVVAETATDGILTLNEKQVVVYANAAASRILGYSAEMLQGMELARILPEPASEPVSSHEAFELDALHADGRKVLLEVSAGEYQVNQLAQRTLIFRDVTQRKEVLRQLEMAKEQAEASDRSKSEFVANISHELRTPLNAILGYSEMLLEDTGDNGHHEYQRDLKRIVTAGKHLLALINDILDMSKIEAGKMEIHPEWVDVESLINECVATVQPLAEKNRNHFIVRHWEPLGYFWTDATRFRQSLFNLLSNACKFTQDGLVELSMRLEVKDGRQWTHWTVKDSGRGISAEDQKKLFMAFNQVNWSTSKHEGGTGLGLVITKKLCQAMGGYVSLESELGQGAAFTLSLPRLMPEDLLDR